MKEGIENISWSNYKLITIICFLSLVGFCRRIVLSFVVRHRRRCFWKAFGVFIDTTSRRCWMGGFYVNTQWSQVLEFCITLVTGIFSYNSISFMNLLVTLKIGFSIKVFLTGWTFEADFLIMDFSMAAKIVFTFEEFSASLTFIIFTDSLINE